MSIDPKDIATLAPTFLSTIYKHFKNEVPDSNWDLKLHVSITMMKGFLECGRNNTIESQQSFLSKAHIPSPPSITVKKDTVPETCRSQAEDIMSDLLNGKEERVGWRWKEDVHKQQQPIEAEWVEAKNRRKVTTVDRVILYIHGGAYFLGSAAQHRFLTQRIVKAGAARSFSVDYRLAPQSPFPAALVDVLAAYLYLIRPPVDSGLEPISPKNIIVMGDSAGGGLTIALLLVIRDAGLPQPVGGICWSPWVDLFHSLPSIFDNSTTDYIPNGFVHKASPANPIKDHTDIQQRLDRIQYYAYNSALDIPYVSSIMADDLGGLGQLYITCGSGERLRDESILLAHKASKIHAQLYENNNDDGNRKKSYPPTKVELNVFEAMPHVFQMFLFHPSSISSIERTGAFIRKAIPEIANSNNNIDNNSFSSFSSFSSLPFPLQLPPSSLLVSSNISRDIRLLSALPTSLTTTSLSSPIISPSLLSPSSTSSSISTSSLSSSNLSSTSSSFFSSSISASATTTITTTTITTTTRKDIADTSFPIDNIDDVEEDINEFFISKRLDCKGICKSKNHILDEATLQDWINRLGKLPDFKAHPEFLEL